MAESGLCWSLLAILAAIFAALVKNGLLLRSIAAYLAVQVATELAKLEQAQAAKVAAELAKAKQLAAIAATPTPPQ